MELKWTHATNEGHQTRTVVYLVGSDIVNLAAKMTLGLVMSEGVVVLAHRLVKMNLVAVKFPASNRKKC